MIIYIKRLNVYYMKNMVWLKKQIGNYTYEKDSSIKLNEFLKDVNFSIDNFAKECKNIESSNITLEISATDEEDKTTIYKVPLSMNKSCN
ncbi:MAG: hypothetical protein L6V91_08765 [Bacilli bacterium]|nr:MAG: hypothetical protein L6V91_08765 [Bacilli bacterium]